MSGVAEVPSSVVVPTTVPEASLTTYALVFGRARGTPPAVADPDDFARWFDTALAEASTQEEFQAVLVARLEWFVARGEVDRAWVALDELTTVDPLETTREALEGVRRAIGPWFRLVAARMPLVVAALLRCGQDPRPLLRRCREALERFGVASPRTDLRLGVAERIAATGVLSPDALDGLGGDELERARVRRLLAALASR